MKNVKLFAVLALIAYSPSKSERTKELSADDDSPGIAWSKDTVDALDILRRGIEEKVSVVEVDSARSIFAIRTIRASMQLPLSVSCQKL